MPIICDSPTPYFSSGCELLLAYDKNYDGLINFDELNQSYTDYESGIITEEEFDFVSDAYINDGINVVCPGCYATPEPAVLYVLLPVDEKTGGPISGAVVYICESSTYCDPGTNLGAPPRDISFSPSSEYKLGVWYTVIVRAEGYIARRYNRSYKPSEEKTLTTFLCACNNPTTHFSSGRELLEHYDTDNDGFITASDVATAATDHSAGIITIGEFHSVEVVCASNHSIDAMCLGKRTVNFGSIPSGANVEVD